MSPIDTAASTAETTEPKTTSFYNTTLSFPQSLDEIMAVPRGDFLASDTFTIDKHTFRLKVYPRGGGGRSKTTGFGMAYQPTIPNELFGSPNEKVGVYLQYMNPLQDTTTTIPQSVDATFALRIKGCQSTGTPRFDVEWRAGMRFAKDTRLGQGVANDFGAHLMQTSLLPTFLGGDKNYDDQSALNIQVEIMLHHDREASSAAAEATANATHTTSNSLFFFRDVRETPDSPLRVGSIVVPVLRKLAQRPDMMAQGVYPGVEYRVLRMTQQEADVFYYEPNVQLDLKPIYPLVPQLERPWPVTVEDQSIPKLVSPFTYNLVSAIGSLATAVTGLCTALAISTLVSFFVIPSRSMEPTLEVGDVLLVEKVSPRIQATTTPVGDIVLFSPPPALRAFVEERSGTVGSRDLFVKRVAAAGAGDTVTFLPRTGQVQVVAPGEATQLVPNQLCVEPTNRVLQYLPQDTERITTTLKDGEVVVLGDCGAVSIDSRVWGTLPQSSIIGRPLLRVWPLSKFGPVK